MERIIGQRETRALVVLFGVLLSTQVLMINDQAGHTALSYKCTGFIGRYRRQESNVSKRRSSEGIAANERTALCPVGR